jgi:hypothetical protein
MADHLRAEHLSPDVFRQVVAWLRCLPESTEVPWSSPALTPSRPFATLWAGVRVDGCPAACRFGWIWSFARAVPRDRRLDPVWIQAPPDLQIHTYGIPGRSPVLLEWARPTDDPWRAPTIPEPLPRNGRWLRTAGWSADAITATLENWVAIHTGRTDVRFRWDPTSSPNRLIDLVRLESAADRPTADRDDVYQVSPGVYATGAMFDLLLALEPADAARVTASLARI